MICGCGCVAGAKRKNVTSHAGTFGCEWLELPDSDDRPLCCSLVYSRHLNQSTRNHSHRPHSNHNTVYSKYSSPTKWHKEHQRKTTSTRVREHILQMFLPMTYCADRPLQHSMPSRRRPDRRAVTTSTPRNTATRTRSSPTRSAASSRRRRARRYVSSSRRRFQVRSG